MSIRLDVKSLPLLLCPINALTTVSVTVARDWKLNLRLSDTEREIFVTRWVPLLRASDRQWSGSPAMSLPLLSSLVMS